MPVSIETECEGILSGIPNLGSQWVQQQVRQLPPLHRMSRRSWREQILPALPFRSGLTTNLPRSQKQEVHHPL